MDALDLVMMKRFGGGSGGGGSGGGGVLVVHGVIDDDTMTLDKTWQEISNAATAGQIPFLIYLFDGATYMTSCTEVVPGDDLTPYAVRFTIGPIYTCETADGYPATGEGGGGDTPT